MLDLIQIPGSESGIISTNRKPLNVPFMSFSKQSFIYIHLHGKPVYLMTKPVIHVVFIS